MSTLFEIGFIHIAALTLAQHINIELLILASFIICSARSITIFKVEEYIDDSDDEIESDDEISDISDQQPADMQESKIISDEERMVQEYCDDHDRYEMKLIVSHDESDDKTQSMDEQQSDEKIMHSDEIPNTSDQQLIEKWNKIAEEEDIAEEYYDVYSHRYRCV